MSNKEIIQENNLKLQDCVDLANNLPNAQNIEPIYGTSDYVLLRPSFMTDITELIRVARCDDYYFIAYKNTTTVGDLFKLVDGQLQRISTTSITSDSNLDEYVIYGYDDDYVYVGYYVEYGRVMYKISLFDGSVENGNWSSSTYLSQFIPFTAKEGYVISCNYRSSYARFYNMPSNSSGSSISQYVVGTINDEKHLFLGGTRGYSSNATSIISMIKENNTWVPYASYIENRPSSDIDIYGFNYMMNKMFASDGIYGFNSSSSTVLEKITDWSYKFIESINDKYYILYNYANENSNESCQFGTFDENTNEFTILSTFKNVGSQCLASKDGIYMFNQSDIQIGFTYNNKDYYFTNDATVNSDVLLEGNVLYDITLQTVLGTMTNNGDVTIEPTTEEQIEEQGYYNSLKINAVTSSIDNNIVAENIKKDISILGVTGTYEGVMSQSEYNECLTLSQQILGEISL